MTVLGRRLRREAREQAAPVGPADQPLYEVLRVRHHPEDVRLLGVHTGDVC